MKKIKLSKKKLKQTIDNEEIETLFRNLKKSKSETIAKKNEENEMQRPLRSERSAISNKIEMPYSVSPEAPVHRVDIESGLPVYKAHLLKVLCI